MARSSPFVSTLRSGSMPIQHAANLSLFNIFHPPIYLCSDRGLFTLSGPYPVCPISSMKIQEKVSCVASYSSLDSYVGSWASMFFSLRYPDGSGAFCVWPSWGLAICRHIHFKSRAKLAFRISSIHVSFLILPSEYSDDFSASAPASMIAPGIATQRL